MLFGYKEMLEYEKTCTDPIVLAIIKIAKQKNSTAVKWFNYSKELEKTIQDDYEKFLDSKFWEQEE